MLHSRVELSQAAPVQFVVAYLMRREGLGRAPGSTSASSTVKPHSRRFARS